MRFFGPGPNPPHTVSQQAPDQKGRGARSSGPQRPHSFSEAPRRPASMSSDGFAGDSDPSKDGLTASATSVSPASLPPVCTLFGSLESDPGFLSPCSFSWSSEEETLDITVQRVRVLPPGTSKPPSLFCAGEPVGTSPCPRSKAGSSVLG